MGSLWIKQKLIWFHSRNTNPSRKALLSLFAAQIVNDSWTWGSSLIVGQWRDSYFMSWAMMRSLSILVIKLTVRYMFIYVCIKYTTNIQTYIHIYYMHICKRVGLQSLFKNTPPNCCPGHRHRNPGCGAWGHASTFGGLGTGEGGFSSQTTMKKTWKTQHPIGFHWLTQHLWLMNTCTTGAKEMAQVRRNG